MGDEYPSLLRRSLQNSNHDTLLIIVTTIEGSEEMSLVQLFVPTEVAHDTVAELGELGDMQFKDVSQFLAALVIRILS